jgi:hypothetical protein
MRKYLLSLTLAVVLLGSAVAAGAAGGNPDPSDRLRFDAIAGLMLQPLEACPNLGSAPIMADLTGPTEIKPARPGKGGTIPVEILSLNLSGGGSPNPSGRVADSFFDVFVMLHPTRMSWGQINYESFFDVFFELEITDPHGVRHMLRSVTPVRLMGINMSVPGPSMLALIETRFESNQAVSFFLPSPGTQVPSNPCVELKQMSYVPVNPSAAIIKRELIQIEKKLDRLLKLNEPTTPPPQCDGPCP